jgi:hypothetical protein
VFFPTPAPNKGNWWREQDSSRVKLADQMWCDVIRVHHNHPRTLVSPDLICRVPCQSLHLRHQPPSIPTPEVIGDEKSEVK